MQEVKEHITNKKPGPQLRFKEFDEQWRKITLGNLFTFKNGLNSDKGKYGSGIKFINVLDIIGCEVIIYDSIIGKVEVTENELEKNEVVYGDVLFQRSSETREEVGQANIYVDEHKSAVFGGFVIRGRKKLDYNPYFMNYLLKTSAARKEITTKSGGSTRYNVGQESLSQVYVNLASLPEQQKIASFLSAVDQKIQQLTKKKALLEQYKKGVMQQLFSGQLRFKDENGNPYPNWEEKKLNDVSVIKKGEQLNRSDLIEDGLYPSLSGGMSPSGYTNKWNTPENTITISEGGNSCGYVGLSTIKFWCGGHCYSLLKIIKSINNSFLFQVLKYHEQGIMRLRVGSGLPNIQKKDLSVFKMSFPCFREQQKIATYLSSIDTKIESVTNQITQTQTFKKGLLQQMFV